MTNHDIIFTEILESIDQDLMGGDDLYEMLKCRGCDAVALRHTIQFGPNGVGGNAVIQYPPVISRRMPNWAAPTRAEHGVVPVDKSLVIPEVPTALCKLMREVYTAVQNDSRNLAAMGIRAAIEFVLIDKIGDNMSFKANLDAFQNAGYLSSRQRGHLDVVLDAGNATIHRGWTPTDSNIIVLLDITESIIEVSYLHDKLTDSLSRKIPQDGLEYLGSLYKNNII